MACPENLLVAPLHDIQLQSPRLITRIDLILTLSVTKKPFKIFPNSRHLATQLPSSTPLLNPLSTPRRHYISTANPQNHHLQPQNYLHSWPLGLPFLCKCTSYDHKPTTKALRKLTRMVENPDNISGYIVRIIFMSKGIGFLF